MTAIAEALGSIKNVDPRSIWPSESGDFTPWLAEHADLLGAALGLDIEIEQREASVGAFSLDLLGKEVGSDRVVIVENQLERTDHGHLGQLLAYAGGLDARIIVWVSPEVRDEHRDAIHWLNEQTTDAVAFFAVEIELWRIGDSLPAPRFNVVARPSGFQRKIVSEATTAAPTELRLAYQKFFSDLLRRVHTTHQGFTNRNPDNVRYDSWMDFAVGRTGFFLRCSFYEQRRFRMEIYIDTGDGTKNKAAFDRLYQTHEAIASALGETLTWERLDNARASRVFAHRDGHVESAEAVLEAHKRWAVDLLPRFRDAFEPRIVALDLDALVAEAYAEAEA